MTADATSLTAATQATLAAEYAAVFGYGVVGAHSVGVARIRATRAMDWHSAQQTSLRAALTRTGATAPAPQPAYELPFAVVDAAAAARLAAELEEGVAAAYADLVAVSAGGDRQGAAVALAACAVRATQWRGFSVPFPGLPERAAPR